MKSPAKGGFSYETDGSRSWREEAKQIGLYAPGNAAVITSVVAMLDALMKSIWEIDQDIKALVMQEPFIQKNIVLLQSIPGIGPHSSIALLAEIGNFTLFQKPKQLVAYFGLDPSQRQSGTFTGSKNKLSKRGSAYVRALLHLAVITAIAPQKKRPAVNTNNSGTMLTATDGTQYFIMGKIRIKVSEHFAEDGKPLNSLLEDVIQHAAAAS